MFLTNTESYFSSMGLVKIQQDPRTQKLYIFRDITKIKTKTWDKILLAAEQISNKEIFSVASTITKKSHNNKKNVDERLYKK